MTNSKDILVFQILNWVSSFFWFAVFVRVDQTGAFGAVAGAELLFGFVGVYVTNLSLRLQGQVASRITEWKLLWLRLSCVVAVGTVAMLGVLSWVYVFAVAAFACTPAHLPLLLGYRLHVLWPLLLRLPLAALLYWSGGIGGGVVIVSMCYFAPVTAYGILTYIVYFRALSPINDANSQVKAGTAKRLQGALQFAVTALVNGMQAKVVEAIVLQMPALAVLERLLRSAYSFVFPYLIRKKVLTLHRRLVLGQCVVGFLVVGATASHFAGRSVLILLPVLGDIYTSAVAGHVWWLDIACIAFLAIFSFSL